MGGRGSFRRRCSIEKSCDRLGQAHHRRVLQLHNNTPFAAALLVFPNREGLDTLVVTVQATLEWAPRLAVAAFQRSVPVADDYWGDPSASSLRYASEARLPPPGTDVVVLGEAHAPGLRLTTSCPVTVQVGPVSCSARVIGDRVWQRGPLGLRASSPQPFTTIPLRHERAVGGREEPRNPVGCGLRSGRANAELDGTPLPNIEHPDDSLGSPDERPPPVGFGAIPPAWAPRSGYAGTYDLTWQRERCPYLPLDFDPRFLHTAVPALTTRAPLRGGEPVTMHNLSPRGHESFELPACPLTVDVRLSGAHHRPPPQLVTVLLEPTTAVVTLVWQAALTCDGEILFVDSVDVGLIESPAIGGL